MTDINKYSQKIRKDAEDLLKKTSLVEILKEFGEVNIEGSFKYDLMWDPDIDIVVICKDPRKMSVEALKKILDLRLFQKHEYGDFAKFKRIDRPESYMVNFRLPFEGQKWEFEVWFFDEYGKDREEINELIKNKLNEENKKIILEMKKKRSEEGVTKHIISSLEIYRKVLVEGIKSYENLF